MRRLLSILLTLIINISIGLAQTPYAAPDNLASGNCLDFDGVNDYVSCGNPADFNMTNALTVEAWVRRDVSGSLQEIVAKWIPTNGRASWNLLFEFDQIGFAIDKTGNHVPNVDYTFILTPENYTDTDWHHVAGTYQFVTDGTSIIRLYVDGELRVSRNDAVGPIFQSPEEVKIGAFGSGRYFNGQMDDIRIWNVARTQAEIRDNMCLPLQGNEAGLVAYWNMNEGTGGVVNDLTSNGNDGALQ